MNNNVDFRNKIIKHIEKCINEGKLYDAKLVIKKYEEKIKYDPLLYSYKAVMYLSVKKTILTQHIFITMLNYIAPIVN